MASRDPSDSVSQPERTQQSPLLQGVSPRQMAAAIRSLDSRLVSIAVDHQETPPVLLYTFAVAGKSQTFRLPIGEAVIESIADLYPDAVEHEQEIERDLDVRFRQSVSTRGEK